MLYPTDWLKQGNTLSGTLNEWQQPSGLPQKAEGRSALIDCFIGIDPGVTGAIVILGRQSELIAVHDMPVVKSGTRRELQPNQLSAILANYIEKHGAEKVFVTLEKHTPRPGQGISSQCKLARICGVIEGIVAAFRVSYQIAHPRTWSKVMRDVEGKDVKTKAMLSAGRRWPDLDLSKKKHHNRADAALLAEYGRLYHDAAF